MNKQFVNKQFGFAGALVAAFLTLATGASAEEHSQDTVQETITEGQGRQWLGHGRLINNDLIGDLHDRWQTGSVTGSHARGQSWSGQLPETPFSLMEYRVGGQVIAPSNLATLGTPDRPFAGALMFGAHTHFQRGGLETALGVDLVMTGPQTGLDDLQTALHEALDISVASDVVVDGQIENALHLGFVGEWGQSFDLGGGASVRPFAELRYGVETIARLGADFHLGPAGQNELMVRDTVTGQRYRVILDDWQGSALVLGGDIAWVDESIYLPASSGVVPSSTRSRLRMGVHWQDERQTGFLGVTLLSPEFEGQDESQVVGSLRLRIEF